MPSKRDQMYFCSGLMLVIMLICFLIRISSGPDAWAWTSLGIAALISAGIFSVIAVVLDVMDGRRPLVAYNEYSALKRRLVKRLRKLKATGKLDQAELQRQKTAFLLAAEQLGVMHSAAEEDFNEEIKWRVMRS